MRVIISHVNTDFDALASMMAAKKLYPDAKIAISDKQETKVKQFLNIYRDTISYISDREVSWEDVTELIIVDVASLPRVGAFMKDVSLENMKITVYDHHPKHVGDVVADESYIEEVGAAVTLLLEKIKERELAFTAFEATVFGLGIYTDTGFFTNDTTTARDLEMTAFLMEQGMNIDMVQRFAEHALLPQQQTILNDLFMHMEQHTIDGLQVVVSAASYDEFQNGLATITQKLLDITNVDAVLTVVGMKNHVYIVGRASSDRVNLLPLLKLWHGGGHERAGSAMVKRTSYEEVYPKVKEQLSLIFEEAITARDLMVSPVKTLNDDTTIEEAGRRMYRYGHSGYPVVQDGKMVGIITRRDLDKANHHGLGHAPVKAYMSTELITIAPDLTLEEIQQIIIEHNIGRLPVLEDGELIGIVTRTNIIKKMHEMTQIESTGESEATLQQNLAKEMKAQLPSQAYSLLEDIRKTATKATVNVYLIGGIVRDIFLKRPNDDVDIVVEGDGIQFAKQLQTDYGGEVVVHESFGTATWDHPEGFSIDVTTSRLEYYDRPASLPNVETSTLAEDLQRRDFTINAMAICLTGDQFGKLVDPYRGQQDLIDKKIKILHNLSFVEDPTRVLRAVRFETRFDFLMDKQTEQLALHSIEQVVDLSAQRIVEDMKRIFKEKYPLKAIERLFDLQFWQQFQIPEAVKETVLQQAEKLEKLHHTYLDDRPTWFEYFLLAFYEAKQLREANKFALTKKELKLLQELTTISEIKDIEKLTDNAAIHLAFKPLGDRAILFYVSTHTLANEKEMMTYIEKRQHLKAYLTGADLIEAGFTPGERFSEILLQLEVAVLNDEVQSKSDALAWLENQK